MTDRWLLRIYQDSALEMFKECVGPVELGRQDTRAGELVYQMNPLPERGVRIPIARTDEVTISRRTAWVEMISPQRVVVRNISTQITFGLEGGVQLRPGQESETHLPVALIFGTKMVRIQKSDPKGKIGPIQRLDQLTDLPLKEDDAESPFTTMNPLTSSTMDASGVISWLRAMIRVLQSAASDADFFEKAAQAVVEVVHLDLGRVLTYDGKRWTTAAFFPKTDEDEQNHPPSRMVLEQVCQEKRTCWLDPLGMDEDCSSLAGVSSVVAAPVLSRTGKVIAVLYGDRRFQSMMAGMRPVSRLEAMLVEVLAVGVSAGLARLEEERAKLSLQTQFEQFFTPELARHLATRPELLVGRELEITVLFCDIRGFSRIARTHKTSLVLEWINDVLSTLSECVLNHQGVLIDYIGDELMAMWGAPEAQVDHAERACRAANDMISCLTVLNQRWEAMVGESMGLGIGINTGMARVGNTGSRRKFKYGPLGDTVNVASRVQGATKYFKSSLLITRATHDRLGAGFPRRRLGSARVINIADPIELFELFPPDQPDVQDLCSGYDEALKAFEAQQFLKATGILGRLVSVHRNDGPSFALLARAINSVVDEPENFDPAFRLKGK